ncbi:hypothetical protein CBF08_09715 [Salmonella enterica]|nr:hypothetical protein [Salmonella enterica]ECI4631012.1 hypothetical protein [Salmonella enterica subsp. enterica serovar Hartford]
MSNAFERLLFWQASYHEELNVKQKYCQTKSTQSQATRARIIDEWFSICEQQQEPCIRLHWRGKRANVHWDYLSYHHELDEIFSGQKGDALRSHILDMFSRAAQELRDTKMTCMAARDTADFERLPERIAVNIAAELYDLVVRHVKRYT